VVDPVSLLLIEGGEGVEEDDGAVGRLEGSRGVWRGGERVLWEGGGTVAHGGRGRVGGWGEDERGLSRGREGKREEDGRWVWLAGLVAFMVVGQVSTVLHTNSSSCPDQ